MLPESVTQDKDRLRRFEQEAFAASALNHPNILTIHDIGSEAGSPFVVFELLEGQTLRERLAAGPLPEGQAIEYAVQIANGMAAAHEKGIVHRDLKPENLFVTRDGRVKILDFGLAKLTHPERSDEPPTEAPTATAGTQPGVVMGTIGYMSPEQVKGLPTDPRSDLFSFGAVLYEMLVRPPRVRGRVERRDDERDPAGRAEAAAPRQRRVCRSSASCAAASRRRPSVASSRPATWPSRCARARASEVLRPPCRRSRLAAARA